MVAFKVGKLSLGLQPHFPTICPGRLMGNECVYNRAVQDGGFLLFEGHCLAKQILE